MDMKDKPSFAKTALAFFAILCILFIPFTFSLITFQLRFTDLIFGRLIGYISSHVFHIYLHNTKVYSDSVSMYILIGLLFMIAVLLAWLAINIQKWKQYSNKWLAFCYSIALYYLILQLMKYGAGKVFKDQFYLPEPNTLYTPMGKLDRDILFWSSVGTSYSYNVITGSIEIIAGLLFFFRRTRLIGLLTGLVALLQIVLINFSFDISVKLFSLFLVFLNLYLLYPYLQRLLQFFFYEKNLLPKADIPTMGTSHSFIKVFGKSLLAGLVLMEVFYPYIKAGNFNDDKAVRPYLHGAYEVTRVIEGTDTLPAAQSPVRRFFIHRNGYIIFQSPADEMQDFKLSYDTAHSLFILQDYQLKKTVLKYSYSAVDSMLVLQYFSGDKEIKLEGRQLDWKKMPALKNVFHWTVEDN
jgi:hypothetical protein